MKWAELIARVLFSQIFIISGFHHFQEQTIDHAKAHGVLLPEFFVPAAGVLAILSGLSILLGFKAKWGAWGIVFFLVPVTLTMHNFWTIDDPVKHAMQKTMFMKNLSMLGGALVIAYFGAGPVSFDGGKKPKVIKA